MMPSKKQRAVVKSDISPDLFVTDGKPMSFYLRPGPVKRKLQAHIASRGGCMCNVQLPGAILLIDPNDRVSVPESAAHWYVSTTFIHDCIEKNQLLNVEDYRLNPVVQQQSARLPLKRGRSSYTPEEDAAILSFVRKHRSKIGGNRLWQEMQKKGVTGHTWQSMKYRYKVLAKRLSEAVEEKTTEVANKVDENQETEVLQPPSENAASPQSHSPAAEDVETEQMPIDAQPTEPEKAEPEMSNISQSDDPRLAPPEDTNPVPAESTETARAELQTGNSPRKENMSEDDPETPSAATTPKMPINTQQESPHLEEQPVRRVTRRWLKLEASPQDEPYGKKLRSQLSLSTPEKLLLSPQSAAKTRPAAQADVCSPPPKKAKGKSERAATESQEVKSVEASPSDPPQPDEECQSLLETGKKQKEKRKLGILEMATKEFEDDTENSEDEDEVAAEIQPAVTEAPATRSETAAQMISTQSNPAPEPSSQVEAQQPQSASSDSVTAPECPEPAASDPAPAEGPQEACRAHLFIFDSESQEDETLIGDDVAAPSANKDSDPCLTQIQVEEDVQRIKDLMSQTNEDICNVTKALLKTSGDFSAALDLLTNPAAFFGHFWTRSDDDLLISSDPGVREQLQERYGETEVAKRIVFLEMEG